MFARVGRARRRRCSRAARRPARRPSFPRARRCRSSSPQCEDKDGWTDPAPPIRLFANVYDVGTCGIVVLLIACDEGHVLIDTGPAEAAPLVVANIRALGFDAERRRMDRHQPRAPRPRRRGRRAAGADRRARSRRSAAAEAPARDRRARPGRPAGRHARSLPRRSASTASCATATSSSLGPLRADHARHARPRAGLDQLDVAIVRRRAIARRSPMLDSVTAVSADDYRFSDHPDYVATFRALARQDRGASSAISSSPRTPAPAAVRAPRRRRAAVRPTSPAAHYAAGAASSSTRGWRARRPGNELEARRPRAEGRRAGRARGARGARRVGSRRSSSPAARSPRTGPTTGCSKPICRASRAKADRAAVAALFARARARLHGREAARHRLGRRDARSASRRSAPAASTSTRPTSAADRAGAVDLVIPAAQAFGTGQHATTAGCLAMLDAMKRRGVVVRNLADIGTGTGLLAFAALALWPRRAGHRQRHRRGVRAGGGRERAAQRASRSAPRRASWRWSIAEGIDHALLAGRAPYDLRHRQHPRRPADRARRRLRRRGRAARAPAARRAADDAGARGARRLPHRRLPPRRAAGRAATGRSCGCAGAPSEQRARWRGWASPAWCWRSSLFALAGWIGSSIPRNGDWREPRAGRRDHGRDQRRPHRAGPAAGHAREGLARRFPGRRPAACPAATYTHVAVSWGEQRGVPQHPDLVGPLADDRAAHRRRRRRGAAPRRALRPPRPVRRLPPADADARRNTAASSPRSSARCRTGERVRHDGYGPQDVFYDAPGHYTASNTCNQWTSDTLAAAGVRTGWWTPFAGGVMKWVPPPEA